ncbi:MAG: hypothetical protein R3D03_14335 [Geminicoccaceae bacterium]
MLLGIDVKPMAQPVSLTSSWVKESRRRRPDHLFDEVDAGDKLGHRMFHLQACSFRGSRKLRSPSTMNSTVPAEHSPPPWRGRRPARPWSGWRHRETSEGASSMTFWWRRWIEHSRSPVDAVAMLVAP